MLEYSQTSDESRNRIYKTSMSLRKKGLGQRKIKQAIQKDFDVNVPEITISNWIYYGRIPGNNKYTQFRAKPVPNKNRILKLYFKDQFSLQDIGKIFGVSSVTVKKWIVNYGRLTRNKKASMNTRRIKNHLRNLRLIKSPKGIDRLTKEKAYILGVLCGDGHINKNFLQLEINKNDEEFMEEFLKSIYAVYGRKFNYHFRPKKNSIVTYISPEYIVNDLLSISVFGVRRWRVPKCIANSKNTNYITYFLRGFYDSEGCASKHQIMFSVINKNGALGVARLFKKLEIKTSFKHYDKPEIGNVYTVSIYGKENIRKFKDMVGFSLSRKRDKLITMYPYW